MKSGKEFFKAAVAREKVDRPAFLLHATGACAAFAKKDPAAFAREPELVRSTLAELQQVCGADAITSLYDPAAEDEAFASVVAAGGAEVDLADVEDFDLAAHRALAPSFDVTNRLLRTAGQRDAAVCGVASGPISAAVRALGRDRLEVFSAKGMGADVYDAFSAPVTTVLRRLCELGVDAVVLREDVPLDTLPAETVDDCAFAYRMMNAVARHYKVPLVLALQPGQELPEAARSLEIDVMSLPLEVARDITGVGFAIQQRVPDEWLLPADGRAEEHERTLAGLRPSGQVIEAEWFGEERAALERLMRLGRACGSLAPRQG